MRTNREETEIETERQNKNEKERVSVCVKERERAFWKLLVIRKAVSNFILFIYKRKIIHKFVNYQIYLRSHTHTHFLLLVCMYV